MRLKLHKLTMAIGHSLRMCAPAASIWFEIWGSWTQVKKFRFFQAISQTKNRFFRANFRKISVFSGNLKKNSIFQVKFPKNFDFLRQFPTIFRFSREISEKFRFFQAILKKIDFSRHM